MAGPAHQSGSRPSGCAGLPCFRPTVCPSCRRAVSPFVLPSFRLSCNLLTHRSIQPLAMTPPGTGAATLEHQATGRTDADAVDATLAASGDAHAFERLYRAHLGRVSSLVRRMLSDDDPDDVIQDVFVRAWQKLGTFRGESAFGTWLHRLAVNVILGRREI